MDSKIILKFVIDAGEVLLKNGADTTRVEDTMNRILKLYNFEDDQVFVTPTGIFASVIDGSGNVSSMVRRIKERSINLEKISLVNSLSRELSEGKISIDKAVLQLEEINAKHSYNARYKYLSSGVCCGCFAFIFGGGIFDCINAFIAGFLLYYIVSLLNNKKVNGPISNILGAAFAGFFCPMLISLGLGLQMDKTIIGSIVPLLPGLAFTNGVREVFAGEYLSGMCRILDAVLVAICIATGVGVGLGVWFMTTGGI